MLHFKYVNIMKTKYEKLYRFGTNSILFGMPKKSSRLLYLFLIGVIMLIGLVF